MYTTSNTSSKENVQKHDTPSEGASDREQNKVQISWVLHRVMNKHDQVSMSQNHKSTRHRTNTERNSRGINKEEERCVCVHVDCVLICSSFSERDGSLYMTIRPVLSGFNCGSVVCCIRLREMCCGKLFAHSTSPIHHV